MTVPKNIYLTNKDLLREIHISKSRYSSFAKPEYSDYDIIIRDLSEINDEVIQQAKINRAIRLAKEQAEDANKKTKTNISESDVDPSTVEKIDLVFRLMTFAHVPLSPGRKKTVKSTGDNHEKVNFPPFQHWKYNENDELVCVGKSHWKGDLETGKFCTTHGQMTDKLARMILLLCHRYSTKSNIRNYCVDTETQALTKRGWLGIDEITEDDTILSYENGDLKWSRIKSIYRGEYNGLMHKMTAFGVDSLVTPEHKFVTQRGLVKVEDLVADDVVSLTGRGLENSDNIFAASIDVPTTSSGPVEFSSEPSASAYQAMCAIAGRRTFFEKHEDKFVVDVIDSAYDAVKVSDIDFNGGFDGFDPEKIAPTVEYSGRVWCPETEYGCFMARRNGTVFLTGNTYNDEMKGQAILQLTQVCLQFDESRSSNVFSFLTAITSNSVIRVLNTEKRNQEIRDDLLEMNGMSPSWTRTNSGGRNYDEPSD